VQPGLQTGILREETESTTRTPEPCASSGGVYRAYQNRARVIKSTAAHQKYRRWFAKAAGPRRSTSRLVRLLAAREAGWSDCPTATIPRSQVL
jgi:hypothetical protein